MFVGFKNCAMKNGIKQFWWVYKFTLDHHFYGPDWQNKKRESNLLTAIMKQKIPSWVLGDQHTILFLANVQIIVFKYTTL